MPLRQTFALERPPPALPTRTQAPAERTQLPDVHGLPEAPAARMTTLIQVHALLDIPGALGKRNRVPGIITTRLDALAPDGLRVALAALRRNRVQASQIWRLVTRRLQMAVPATFHHVRHTTRTLQRAEQRWVVLRFPPGIATTSTTEAATERPVQRHRAGRVRMTQVPEFALALTLRAAPAVILPDALEHTPDQTGRAAEPMTLVYARELGARPAKERQAVRRSHQAGRAQPNRVALGLRGQPSPFPRVQMTRTVATSVEWFTSKESGRPEQSRFWRTQETP